MTEVEETQETETMKEDFFNLPSYGKAYLQQAGQKPVKQIALFGLAGTGTSSLKKNLQKELFGYEGVSGGDYQRALAAERGISPEELVRQNTSDPSQGTDRNCDMFLLDKVMKREPLIIEARIGHVLVAYGGYAGFSVLLKAPAELCANRNYEKLLKDHPDLTPARAVALTIERDENDRSRLEAIYPGCMWQETDFDFVLKTEHYDEKAVCRLVKQAYVAWLERNEHLFEV